MRSKAKLLESLANQFLKSTASNEQEKCDGCRCLVCDANRAESHLCKKCSYKFNVKLAADPSAQESNLEPAVLDAFFGPPSPGLGHPEFVKKINKTVNNPKSNFQAITQDIDGNITIDVAVDAPAKSAKFIVRAKAQPSVIEGIKKELELLYRNMYNQTPSAQLQTRLAAGTVRPANIRGTANLTKI